MKRLLVFLVFVVLFTSCHWQRAWRWGNVVRKKGEVCLVTIMAPGGQGHNGWTAVLADLLSKRDDLRIDRKAWQYALWADFRDQYLSVICYNREGRVVFLSVVGTDRFMDRQQGMAMTEGTGNVTMALQRELDRCFREGSMQ